MNDQQLEIPVEARVHPAITRGVGDRSRPGTSPVEEWLEHPEKLVGSILAGVRQSLRSVRNVQTMPTAVLCGRIEQSVRLWPAFSAATMGTLHFGEHAHAHMPYLTAPATPPVRLPSLGPVLLGCSPSVLIRGQRAARQGDQGLSVSCGGFLPLFVIETGSATVLIGGSRAARAADVVDPCRPLRRGPAGRDPLNALLALKLGPLVALQARVEFWWALFSPLADAAVKLLAPVSTDAQLGEVDAPEERKALEERRAFEAHMVDALAPEVVVMLALRYLPQVRSRQFAAAFPKLMAASSALTVLGGALEQRGLQALTHLLQCSPAIQNAAQSIGAVLRRLLPASLPTCESLMQDPPVLGSRHFLAGGGSSVQIGGLPIPSTDSLLRAFRNVAGHLIRLRLEAQRARLVRRLIPELEVAFYGL